MKNMKIAAVCMEAHPYAIDRNLNHIADFSRKAADKGVEIICFPELSITGYILDNPSDVYSESISQEIIERVSQMARAINLVILAGMIEKTQRAKPYISQVVATPQGILGIYRKTHLSPPEKKFFHAGNYLSSYSYGGVIFGVQLCYDAHFPEISTKMALEGVEIIFIPHASPRGTPDEKIQSWLRHLPARAFDNSVFLVACNQVGRYKNDLSFPGTAMVLNPVGNIIESYSGTQEKMIITDLKENDWREIRNHRMKHFLPHRRPELYSK
ncbi:MAG: nitrilase [Deltaproteobacteria bacterium]|nr:nitrilase [Deltaproteobacteria bacterium]